MPYRDDSLNLGRILLVGDDAPRIVVELQVLGSESITLKFGTLHCNDFLVYLQKYSLIRYKPFSFLAIFTFTVQIILNVS